MCRNVDLCFVSMSFLQRLAEGVVFGSLAGKYPEHGFAKKGSTAKDATIVVGQSCTLESNIFKRILRSGCRTCWSVWLLVIGARTRELNCASC